MFKKCWQCKQIKLKGTMTKCPLQNQTHRTAQQHAEQQYVTYIQTNHFCSSSSRYL